MRAKAASTATDQLSLELEAAFPRLPTALRPMLARPASAPFDSADHLFEPTWGGRRALAFVEPAVLPDGAGGWSTAEGRPSVRVVDARGRDLAARLRELGSLSLRVDARSAVLDGEIVVVDGSGRVDAIGLRARLSGEGERPVAYLAFDLLYLDGLPLLTQPLRRRRELLARALRPGPEVLSVPAIECDGIALYAAVAAQRLAGVRARVAASPYLPGVRSTLWRSISVGAAGEPDTSATEVEPAPDMTGPRGGVGPVLAVIRRLPLEEG